MVGRKRWVVTDEMLEALKAAHANGETILSVAKRFNAKYGALRDWATKLGLKFRKSVPKGTHRSPETLRKIREAGNNRRFLHLKNVERDAALVNDYMRDKNQTWSQLAEKHNIKESEVKVIIGEHLMRVCRADDECPWKPLLPEYKGEKN